jgi:Type I phosphodiesterase / nucleotide pyrophosphatase
VRHAAVALALAVFVCLSFVPFTAAQNAPRLAVIVVVDQMRADYFDQFGKNWNGGLKRFATQGALFVNAAYPYLETVTCAGHATIGTGTFPRTHGAFQNVWWDRKSEAQVTCTEDSRASDFGYTAPVKGGDGPSRLQRPTFADVMRSERGSRVVSLSLKERSAIMLAGRGGDAVTWLSDALDSWVTSSAYTDRGVPAVQAFLQKNPLSADFGKTWSRSMPEDKYRYPDDGAGEAPPRGWSSRFPHTLTGIQNAPDLTYLVQWERSPFADAYLGRFAAAMVDAFALGRRSGAQGTDILAVSFSAPDFVGHSFGPRSEEVEDAFIQLDRTLGTLFDHLDETVGRGRWVAGLSSDHGVTPIPEQLLAEGKGAGRLDTRVIGSIADGRLRATLGEGKYVAGSLGNDLYFMPGVYDKIRASRPLSDGLVQALRDVPGIARVFKSEELRDPVAAQDDLQRAAALSYVPGRSGDIVLVPKPGWMFSTSGTTHGTASPDDQRVPLAFLGPGVRAGQYSDTATPADLAPTLAALCSLKLSNVEGRVLTSALGH